MALCFQPAVAYPGLFLTALPHPFLSCFKFLPTPRPKARGEQTVEVKGRLFSVLEVGAGVAAPPQHHCWLSSQSSMESQQ